MSGTDAGGGARLAGPVGQSGDRAGLRQRGGGTALRGDNLRVTGYAPYWLVAFGVGLASVLQIWPRRIVQVYLA